ncbi:MAG: tetratricopeptide repeat protein [Wenzhouxiangellaceae bacterium]|nr:tetratricopeptide repeat protein [Wenzhouxiangellaceae bacterium]
MDRAAQSQAGEAAAVGDYHRALEIYRPLIENTRSPELARQAAQLAAAIDDWDAVDRATARWRALEPQSRAAVQLAVIAQMQRGRVVPAVDLMLQTIFADDRRAENRVNDSDVAWSTAIALLASADSRAAASSGLDALFDAVGPDSNGFEAFQRSRLAWQMNDPSVAVELAEAAYEAEPGFEHAVWAARILHAHSQPAKALEYYRAARFHEPASGDAALAESELLRELGRDEEALEILQQLPATAETLYSQGTLQHELGYDRKAEATWHELASNEGQGDVSRHAWLTGLLADLLEMDEQAVSWYEKVGGELGPRANLRRAVVLGRSGEIGAARALLAGLQRPSDSELAEQAWLVEGQILVDHGQQQQALDHFSESLIEMPDSTALLYARAMVAVGLNDLALAEQDLRTIIQREPDNAIALNALGYTLSDRTDRQKEAMRLIERALALDPENAAILDSMGWVLVKLGKPEQGLPYLRRAAELEQHPEMIGHLVETLWQLGLKNEARGWVDRTRDEFEDDAAFIELLERLGLD